MSGLLTVEEAKKPCSRRTVGKLSEDTFNLSRQACGHFAQIFDGRPPRLHSVIVGKLMEVFECDRNN